MLNERKLTERELDKRTEAIQGLLSNKRTLVKKYGKDAEKVMYGIATKQAKNKVEGMNKDKIKELIQQALSVGEGAETDSFDFANPTGGPTLDPIPRKVGRSTGKSYINRPSGPAKFPKGLDERVAKIDEMIDYDEALNLRAIKAELEGEIQGVRMEMDDEGDESKADYYGDILNRFESRLAKVQRQLDGYDMNEEVTKSEEEKLKKISKELKGASKMHASQSKKIAKLVKEKLTKKSSVEDHVEDFKDSNAPQFKGKSKDKKVQMAVASYLSKINESDENSLIPAKGQNIRIRGEHHDGHVLYYGGNYVIGNKVEDDDLGPSVELFNKSKRRFVKAGEKNVMSIKFLLKQIEGGSIKIAKND